MAIRSAVLYLCLVVTSTTRTSPLAKKEWTVNLLVARHGVSCTNVIEKWSSLGSLDMKRGFMLDPPLAGMADEGNEEARHALNRWSEESGFNIDAVLSSVLLRAMQTAVAMHDADPLYVAPFLREHANGYSNGPASQEDQTLALQGIKSGQKVNYTFVEADTGYAKGTWEDFVGFLQDEFLPFIIGKLEAEGEQQRPITLLIATHSKFLKEQSSALSDRCKDIWSPTDGKPFNSQVFMVKYSFTMACSGCEKKNLLEPKDEECKEVYHGTAITDDEGNLKPLCVKDMGDRCTDKIAKYSMSPTPLIQKTVEWNVYQKALEVEKASQYIEKRRKKLDCPEENWDEDCEEKVATTRYWTKYKDALTAGMQFGSQLHNLLQTECVGGGQPSVKELAKYKDLDLPAGVLPHSGPASEEG